MTVTTERRGRGPARTVIVACDDGRSARRRRADEVQLRLEATGVDALYVRPQAGVDGWRHCQRAGTWIVVCPECAGTVGSASAGAAPPFSGRPPSVASEVWGTPWAPSGRRP
jgi:hypothetical protein